MKKRDLEMALEKVPPFKEPDPSLEQYQTPSSIATDILFEAYSRGDVQGMKVIDLGCGTGIFSVGSSMLGASEVIGFDVSKSAIDVANTFIRGRSLSIEYRNMDVKDVEEQGDTVFMNPPFGCQTRRADRMFLDKSMEISDCIYSLHMSNTLEFVTRYVEKRGRTVDFTKSYKYIIPHTFSFHKKEKQSIEIVLINIR